MRSRDVQHIKVVSLTILIVALVLALFFARMIVLAILIGIGLGVILAPVLSLGEKRLHLSRGLGALGIVVCLLIVLGLAGWGFSSLLIDQARALALQIPAIFQNVEAFVGKYVPMNLQQMNFGRHAATVIAGALTSVKVVTSALAGFIVVVSIALFTAIRSEEYFKGTLAPFPKHMRARVSNVLSKSATELRTWFTSQLLVLIATSIITTLGLWLIGVPYWFILGLFTGVVGFIPYVGAFVAGLLVTVVTLGAEPDRALWVIALYVAIQQIENYLIMPMVMRGRAHLPEVHLIAFLLVMGSLFGVIGAFVAAPLLTVGRCVFLSTFVERMNRAHQPLSERLA